MKNIEITASHRNFTRFSLKGAKNAKIKTGVVIQIASEYHDGSIYGGICSIFGNVQKAAIRLLGMYAILATPLINHGLSNSLRTLGKRK